MKPTSFIILPAALSLNARVRITRGAGRISIEIDGKANTDWMIRAPPRLNDAQ